MAGSLEDCRVRSRSLVSPGVTFHVSIIKLKLSLYILLLTIEQSFEDPIERDLHVKTITRSGYDVLDDRPSRRWSTAGIVILLNWPLVDEYLDFDTGYSAKYRHRAE